MFLGSRDISSVHLLSFAGGKVCEGGGWERNKKTEKLHGSVELDLD